MKLSIGAVLAFAAAVLAKPMLTNSNYTDITQGVPFTLTWSNAEGPVTITLMRGSDPNGLKKVSDLATGQTGTSFTWTPNGLPSGPYAFQISDSSSQPNYSPIFEYSGTGTLPSSTSSATTASASSTSDSASSTTSSSSSSSSTGSSSSTSSSASSSVTSSSASSTLSTTTTSSTPSTTRAAATNTPANSNNGQRFASPLALVLVTVAALVFFN